MLGKAIWRLRIQENPSAVEAPTRTPLWELTPLPQTVLVGRGWLPPPQEPHPHFKISSDAVGDPRLFNEGSRYNVMGNNTAYKIRLYGWKRERSAVFTDILNVTKLLTSTTDSGSFFPCADQTIDTLRSSDSRDHAGLTKSSVRAIPGVSEWVSERVREWVSE